MSSQAPVVEGHFEGAMVATVLRGCRVCGEPHPRVRGLDTDVCPCGTAASQPHSFYAEETVITGGGVRLTLAKALLSLGRRLNHFAKRL